MKMHKIFFSLLAGFALLTNCSSVTLAAMGGISLTETAEGTWEVSAQIVPEGDDASGIAGYAFDVVGVAPASVSYAENTDLFGANSFTDVFGFIGGPSTGPVGTGVDSFFSVGFTQATSSGNTDVTGIGVAPLTVSGAGKDLIAGFPVVLGTLTTPAGLTAANFARTELSLFPMGYQNLSLTPTFSFAEGDAGYAVGITPIGGMLDPLLAGSPDGGPISLQDAFRQGGDTGTAAGAIALSNAGEGELGEITFDLSGPDAGLFGVSINGLSVDLTLDNAAARGLAPDTALSAVLTLNSANNSGNPLVYDLGANVPEPSTVALAGLALVGLVGFTRRK